MIAYFTLPYKNSVLLISSLLFYSWGEPVYILLMLFTVFVNYICALKFNGKHKKAYLMISLMFSLGFLIIFKYADFIIMSINMTVGLQIKPLNLALPIGISFYTFQTISYSIDVYRNEVSAEKNYFLLATYVSLFPQLIAGPIVRYSDVIAELKHRVSTSKLIFDGLNRFTIGLSKKVILANTLAEVVNNFYLQKTPSVASYWIYAVAYTLQIYFDFSGYSDMAIGIGKIFGFKFLENFNYPFTASSITEFWRRWHMSLGTFFKDYVYIPLGGSRVNVLRWIMNIFIVWALTGLWHGAAYNFMLWGLLFAVLLIIEKFLKVNTKNKSMLGVIYVFIIVTLSFVIFDASSFNDIISKFKAMFFMSDAPLVNQMSTYLLTHYRFVFLVSFIGITPIPKRLFNKLFTSQKENTRLISQFILIVFGLLICSIMLVDANFNPFLYFRF